MRLLSILPFSPPATAGGAELQMHSLHCGLIHHGVTVDVLADLNQVGRIYQEIDGVRVWGVRFPVLTSNLLRPGNVRFLYDLSMLQAFVGFKIPRPDLVQVTTFRQPALIGCVISKILRVPWIVRIACSGTYGDFRFCESNWLMRWQLGQMVKSVSAVVAIDKSTEVEALENGIIQEKIVRIPNGLRFNRPAKNRSPIKSKNAKIRVAYLGRLALQKRLDTLLNAWKEVVANLSTAELHLAGDGENGESIRSLAVSLGISSSVKFHGHLMDTQEFLEDADIFVNPSESEGLPNAVLEATACGLPVVLSDIPVHREIANTVGMKEYLFPVGDSTALALALLRAIRMAPDVQESVYQSCATFGQTFLPEKRNIEYLKLYRQVLKSRG